MKRLDTEWSCDACGSDEDPCLCAPDLEQALHGDEDAVPCSTCGSFRPDNSRLDCPNCRDGSYDDGEASLIEAKREWRGLIRAEKRGLNLERQKPHGTPPRWFR